ncbi:MAG: hypothetical protein SFU27_09285 [Thermonemataceae bacterium]|nr:hypothetical protein [Thermonemataceae bacterium]
MNTDTLIEKILRAKHYSEVFSRFTFKKQYIDYLKVLHPDVCSHPQATNAVAKVNQYKNILESTLKITDEAGTMQVDRQSISWQGDEVLLKKSLQNFQKLSNLKDEASRHFRKYLPDSLNFEEGKLVLRHQEDFVPLVDLELPEHHVTWLVSRLFELTSWLNQVGFCHAGLTPQALAVVPKTHGIIVLSFYHLSIVDKPLQTISSKFLNWYPSSVFSEKKASPYIDLTLVQRLALYLLGDKTGSGVKLKKTCTPALIDFLLESHLYPYETFDAYRKLLAKLFGKPTFYHLEL